MSKELVNKTARAVIQDNSQVNRTAFTQAIKAACDDGKDWLIHEIEGGSEFRTSLEFSAEFGCTRAAKILLQQPRITADRYNYEKIEELLRIALRFGNVDIFKLCLDWRGKNGEYVDITRIHQLAEDIKSDVPELLMHILQWKGGKGETYHAREKLSGLASLSYFYHREKSLNLLLGFIRTLEKGSPGIFENIISDLHGWPTFKDEVAYLRRSSEHTGDFIEEFGIETACANYTNNKVLEAHYKNYELYSHLRALKNFLVAAKFAPELNALARVAPNPEIFSTSQLIYDVNKEEKVRPALTPEIYSKILSCLNPTISPKNDGGSLDLLVHMSLSGGIANKDHRVQLRKRWKEFDIGFESNGNIMEFTTHGSNLIPSLRKAKEIKSIDKELTGDELKLRHHWSKHGGVKTIKGYTLSYVQERQKEKDSDNGHAKH